MSHPPVTTSRQELTRPLGPQRATLLRGGLAAAGGGLLLAVVHGLMVPHAWRRAALAYLTAVAFALSLSLGALFFVFIQHLARAGWSVLLRRLAEAMALNIVLVAVLFLPLAATVAAGSPLVYPWARWHVPAADHGHAAPAAEAHPQASAPDQAAHPDPHHAPVEAGYPHQNLDALTLSKRAWLNPGFFLVRWVGYFAIWSHLAWRYWGNSRRQDRDADPAGTVASEAFSGRAALLYALTTTLAANDLLMSLNPHWYSAALGVYFFSGAVVGGLATLILLTLGLQRLGVLTRAIGVEHLHDLGKLLFAFVFFWAYIAYSQYMLLWYAHLPETVTWLVHRGASTATPNAWSLLLLVLLAGHFVLPFAGLMSRHVKRRRFWLGVWAGWLLLMHYLDLAWMVMPETGPGLALGGLEIGLAVAVAGLYLAGLAWLLGEAPLVPVGDPRLAESVRFENI